MDKKLFLEKLNEVADWHWEEIKGQSYSSQLRNVELGEPTFEIKIDKIKPKPCPYETTPLTKPGRKNQPWDRSCFWRGEIVEFNDKKFLQQRCITCGSLMTPKGTWIEKPEHYRYAELIYRYMKKGK
jgi:hypothetical protein